VDKERTELFWDHHVRVSSLGKVDHQERIEATIGTRQFIDGETVDEFLLVVEPLAKTLEKAKGIKRIKEVCTLKHTRDPGFPDLERTPR